jgi:hypothetical protein
MGPGERRRQKGRRAAGSRVTTVVRPLLPSACCLLPQSFSPVGGLPELLGIAGGLLEKSPFSGRERVHPFDDIPEYPGPALSFHGDPPHGPFHGSLGISILLSGHWRFLGREMPLPGSSGRRPFDGAVAYGSSNHGFGGGNTIRYCGRYHFASCIWSSELRTPPGSRETGFAVGALVAGFMKFAGTPRASARGGMERGEVRARSTFGRTLADLLRKSSKTPPASQIWPGGQIGERTHSQQGMRSLAGGGITLFSQLLAHGE